MACEAKTKPEKTSAAAFLQAIKDEKQRSDGKTLLSLFEKLTGEPAIMWGPSIIGFGRYDYIYPSGHSGTSAKVGFAVRKSGLVIYLCPGFDGLGMELASLGPYKLGKGCLYLKNLQCIDRDMLSAVISKSVAEIDRRFPPA